MLDISIVAILLVVAVLCALIVLYVKVFHMQSSHDKTILEIKSKIGSIIREVNRTNELNYQVDAAQQKDIQQLQR